MTALEKLILSQDARRGMATDSVDYSVGIMEILTKMKKNLDRERQVVGLG